ncbi:hypothetical protein WK23_01915 [Burkholderia vietnamiensis]|nr:hypothetical protein WK23_01915 [Burkholderia vietnamiensis]
MIAFLCVERESALRSEKAIHTAAMLTVVFCIDIAIDGGLELHRTKLFLGVGAVSASRRSTRVTSHE